VVDPVLLILSLIIVFLLVAGNIYFLAYYSHYADTMFGQSIPAKLVLVSVKISNELFSGAGLCAR
jgi:uncharacterized membrane protein